MKPTTCPYLSIKEDPETQLAFPSIRNCCRRARPIEPVSLEHQATHCLSTNFTHCPVPGRKLNTPLPAYLRAEMPSRNGYLIGAVISVVIILAIVLVGLWQSGLLNRSTNPSPVKTDSNPEDITTRLTPTSRAAASPSPFTATPRSTIPPTSLPSPTETPASSATSTMRATLDKLLYPSPTATTCNPPSGWVTYLVQPDDSLYGIGITFGVTVTELQNANCMGTSEVIYTGQVLYVPNVPTSTPHKYFTRTPTRTVTPTKRNDATHTKSPSPATDTNTPFPTGTNTPRLTNTPKPTLTPFPTITKSPPPLPTATLTPPPTETGF